MSNSTDATPLGINLVRLRREGRVLRQRADAAVAIVEAALVEYGATRHPLVDVLLDVRNTLRHGLADDE